MPIPAAFDAVFTTDVEPDCPPYLDTCHGMREGLPRLLDLLGELGIRGTFFTTGEMARRFPAVIARLVAEGHELGCHGDMHRDFTTLDAAATRAEIRRSTATLREFAPVVSFRAPYLRFPPGSLSILVEHGLGVDSSQARYKSGTAHRLGVTVPGLIRIPASVTSSVLRLPAAIRNPWLAFMRRPLVLFVHPWEAVDFTRSSLRRDCRFQTGDAALRHWRDVLVAQTRRGATFRLLRELAGVGAPPPQLARPAHSDTPLS